MSRLKKARAATKKMDDSFFGEGSNLTISDLPCIKDKVTKVKKTFNYRSSSIEKIEKIAKEQKVSVGDILSDLIDKAMSQES